MPFVPNQNKHDNFNKLYAETLNKARKAQGQNYPAVAALTSTIAECLVDQVHCETVHHKKCMYVSC